MVMTGSCPPGTPPAPCPPTLHREKYLFVLSLGKNEQPEEGANSMLYLLEHGQSGGVLTE